LFSDSGPGFCPQHPGHINDGKGPDGSSAADFADEARLLRSEAEGDVTEDHHPEEHHEAAVGPAEQNVS